MERHRIGNLDVELRGIAQLVLDHVGGLAGRVLEDPGDQLADVLDAHAARRIEAEVVVEQALVRRVVHVDAVGAGEVDLDDAQRIEVARVLAEPVVHRLVGLPVDLVGLDLVALVIVDADVPRLQVRGILLHDRDQVAADDRRRHRPVGMEIDLGDLGIDDRRGPRDLADHGRMPLHHDAVLDHLDRCRRDVDHHVAFGQRLGRQHLEARQVGRELLQAHLRRHVERLIGRIADDAVGLDAVARLEAPDRRIDVGIEDVGIVGCRRLRQVAGNRQALAQHHDGGIGHAELQPLVCGHHRPAAMGNDIGIFGDRRLHGADDLRRQRRDRGAHVGGAHRGRVEAVRPFRAAALLQHLVDRVLGVGWILRECRQRGQHGHSEDACPDDRGARGGHQVATPMQVLRIPDTSALHLPPNMLARM